LLAVVCHSKFGVIVSRGIGALSLFHDEEPQADRNLRAAEELAEGGAMQSTKSASIKARLFIKLFYPPFLSDS
jgi:hypothetical protein